MSQAALLMQFAEGKITLGELEEKLSSSALSAEIDEIIADPPVARALAVALCARRQPTERESVGGCGRSVMLVDGSFYLVFDHLHHHDSAEFWVRAPAVIADYLKSLEGREADVTRQTVIALAKLRDDNAGFYDDDKDPERQKWIDAGLFTPSVEEETDEEDAETVLL